MQGGARSKPTPASGPRVLGADAGTDEIAARAARTLEGMGLIIMPTDTVYGLAASLDSPCALEHVFEAKRRPHDMPLPVLIASTADADRLTREPLSSMARAVCDTFWPGALTVIVEASERVPAAVTAGRGTVGLRVPDNDIARAIIAAAGGALAVTSANLFGVEAAVDVASLDAELLAHVGLVVDGGQCLGGTPSTVVDLTGRAPTVLREGAIPTSAVLAVFDE